MEHSWVTRAVVPIGLVCCILAVLFLAAPPAVADGHTNPPPVEETYEVSDSVAVWERSILTLRADASDAALTIPNADWRVRSPNNDETTLNRDPIPVYDAGDQIGFEFDEDRADKGGLFGDREVHVLRAKTESTAGDTSTTDAYELLSENSEDATFAHVTTTQLDDGALTFADTPSSAGTYQYFLLASNTTIDVSNGDVNVDESATVLGIERVDVRAGSGDVTAPSAVTRGENATFDVDASGLSGDPITQTVILYDEDTYVQQSVVIAITGEIDEDFDLEDDSTVETSISEVNGVASVDGDSGDESVVRSGGVESIVDFLSQGGPSGTAGVQATGDVVLDGSVTTVEQSGSAATVDVGTLANWSEGDYRWVYQARSGTGSEQYVQTGTVAVEAGTDDGPDDEDGTDSGSNGNGDGADGDDGEGSDEDTDDDSEPDDESNETSTDCNTSNSPAVAVSGNQVTASIECIDATTTVPIDLGLDATDDRTNVTFQRVNVTAATDVENVYATVTARTGAPESGPEAPSRYGAVAYLTVDLENVSDEDAGSSTIGFQVPESTLSELDAAPEDVVLLRYHDESWNELATTHQNGTRFHATTPGFSTFAVATPAAAFETTAANLERTDLAAGESVEVTATIENVGTRTGSQTLEVLANDEVSASTNVTLGPGNATTESITLTFDEAGTYDVTVDGVDAGTVSVSADQQSTEQPTGELGSGAPLPLLVLLVVVAVVGIGALVYFRRS